VTINVDPGGPAISGPPPAQIAELIDVIRNVTKLVKAQAKDLGRSKRLQRLILSLDGLGIEGSDETAGQPALLYWLSQVDEIITPLEEAFIDQLVAAYGVDPTRFEDLGLTVDSPAWRLKHAGFSAAYAYAQRPPSRFRRAEGKLLGGIKRRKTAFKIGDSIIGSALAAVPAVGGGLSEGYQEVKENLEALGGIAKRGASAGAAVVKGAGRVAIRVITAPGRIIRPKAPPPPEPVTAEES
jgi:hypothetical protein